MTRCIKKEENSKDDRVKNVFEFLKLDKRRTCS